MKKKKVGRPKGSVGKVKKEKRPLYVLAWKEDDGDDPREEFDSMEKIEKRVKELVEVDEVPVSEIKIFLVGEKFEAKVGFIKSYER